MKASNFKCMALAGIFFANFSNGHAQKPGDRLPELRFGKVFNHTDSIISFSEYDNKNIIIDFWGTGCLSCIESFEKLDKLQEKFGSEAQIILVTLQKKDSVERFFAKRKNLRKPRVPMITEDTSLYDLMPREVLPYIVWIDKKREIRYITDGTYLTERKLSAFCNNGFEKMQNLPEVETVYTTSFNETLSNEVEYFSSISRCSRLISSPDANAATWGKSKRIFKRCKSIRDLFIDAFSEKQKNNIFPYNTVLEFGDSLNYVRPTDYDQINEWNENHSYTYELVLPRERVSEIYKVMQHDLTRFFCVSGRIENRMHNYLTTELCNTMEQKLETRKEPFEATSNCDNYVIYAFIEQVIRYYKLKREMLFEPGRIPAEIGEIKICKVEFVDLNEEIIHKTLNRIGYKIVSKQKKMEVLVLRKGK